MKLETLPLQGRHVRLELYSEINKDEVRAALDVDADAWLLFGRSGQGERFEGWWRDAEQSAAGEVIPFAIRRLADGRVVGTSSYLNIRREHRAVEIGSTFLHPDVRAGVVNPEIKLLMLGHAFEAGAVRVEIVTDLRNARSQAAIAKLGAVREGVLRRHKISWTGYVRDTVVFSIIDQEWPAIRANLETRVAAFDSPAPT